jgi:hypothetical protein
MLLTLQKILPPRSLPCWLLSLAACAASAQPVAGLVPGAGIQTMADAMVTLRDGVTLSLDIYRPAVPGQYPTLYAAGPYPHLADNSAPDSPETGPVEWLVNQGYNYVLASVRGTGTSGGNFRFQSREEQQDHYEIIEWIATQPWSNGQVAGIGAGYYGTAQWHMAIQNPPHLNCVAPYNGVPAPYHDWVWPGGLASSDFLAWYEQRVREPHAYPARGAPRFIELDLRLEQLRHPLLDEYWSVRNAINYFDQIRIPVFVLGNWNPAGPGNSQIFRTLPRLPDSARLLFTDSAELLQDRALLETILLPYYRWCFSDQNPATGHALRPRMQIAVRNQEQNRNLAGWPAAAVRFTPLLLGHANTQDTNEGTLRLTQQRGGTGSTDYGDGTPVSDLTFRSAELTQDLELVGPMLLELYASSTGFDTAFRVEVLEEVIARQLPPAPGQLPTFLNPALSPSAAALTATTGVLVSRGQLKASARPLANTLGADFQPDYAFSNAEAITAGRVYRYDIALQPVAYRFRAGNRIVLKITQATDAALRGKLRKDTLYHNAQYASRLQLPLLPDPLLPLSAPFAPFAPDATTPVLPPIPPDPVRQFGTEEAAVQNQEEAAGALFDSSNPVILLPRR